MELEITENLVLGNLTHAIETLNLLREQGIKIALDDFGTGYASLSYLQQLPIDTLKIDQVFIRGLGEKSGDEAIVSAILAMADGLGLKVVGEGVETLDQLRFLMENGCHEIQGYLLGKPMPQDALMAYIQKHEGAVEMPV